MIERSIYVNNGTEKIGMVTVIEEEGRFGIGWSLCNAKDKFDKVEAKFVSRGRAVKDYEQNTRWFKDIQKVYSFSDAGIELPKVKCAVNDDTWSSVLSSEERIEILQYKFNWALERCIREVIYTCALEYLRRETPNRPEK